METSLVQGSKFVEEAMKQELELAKAKAELQEQQRKQKEMERLIKEHEEEKVLLKEKFSSVADELESKEERIS